MSRVIFCLTLCLALAPVPSTEAQYDFPDSPTGRAAAAIVETIDQGSEERIKRFVNESLDARFKEAIAMEQHLAIFTELHELLAPVDVQVVEKTGPTAARLVLGAGDGSARRQIEYEVEAAEPHRIAGISIDEPSDASDATSDEPIELGDGPWHTQLHRALTGLAADGFSGVAMAVEDGKVTLAEGYGMADRERKIANTPKTVFSIGSITKDFTRAAILKLEEQGKLSTLDPLSKFFPEAPEDKKGIILRYVLEHSAGFHTYHDTEGDHQPMDRKQAEKIILDQELRFEPGGVPQYSNSGYTLLAAIIERVSGVSYQTYVRENLLKPAGMKRTGFFGETIWKENEVATGYGSRSLGEVNSPLHWPGVSWVLEGAGGMVSSLDDLYRWHQAMTTDTVLGEAARKAYHGERSTRKWSAMAGGGEYGFLALVLSYHQGSVAGDVFIVLSNAGKPQNVEKKLVAVARNHLDS